MKILLNPPREIQRRANVVARKAGYHKATLLITDKRRTKYRVIEEDCVFAHYINTNTGNVISDFTAKHYWKPHYQRVAARVVVAIPWDDYYRVMVARLLNP